MEKRKNGSEIYEAPTVVFLIINSEDIITGSIESGGGNWEF
ncbi:MAG: hypothetical protein ACI4TD_10250 [Phocaeicola sp.]